MTSPLPPLERGAVVTVGSFDGIHLGHRAVIDEVLRRARETGRPAILVTFEPHPARVLYPERAQLLLTPGPERVEVLAETGLDYVAVLRFDPAMAARTAESFVTEILREWCRMAALVVGHDHGLGRGRSGDAAALAALGGRLGFEVTVVPPVPDPEGGMVSSSAIRDRIRRGDLLGAARSLGRPYRVSGPVLRGDQRGRTLGVPTVNLAPPPDKLLPPDGVYAVRVEWGGGTALGMLNQGPRPTVGDSTRWLEAHLFDFDADLYDRIVRIEWVAKLREIRRFGSLDELKGQLAQDRAAARAALAAGERPLTV